MADERSDVLSPQAILAFGGSGGKALNKDRESGEKNKRNEGKVWDFYCFSSRGSLPLPDQGFLRAMKASDMDHSHSRTAGDHHLLGPHLSPHRAHDLGQVPSSSVLPPARILFCDYSSTSSFQNSEKVNVCPFSASL